MHLSTKCFSSLFPRRAYMFISPISQSLYPVCLPAAHWCFGFFAFKKISFFCFRTIPRRFYSQCILMLLVFYCCSIKYSYPNYCWYHVSFIKCCKTQFQGQLFACRIERKNRQHKKKCYNRRNETLNAVRYVVHRVINHQYVYNRRDQRIYHPATNGISFSSFHFLELPNTEYI